MTKNWQPLLQLLSLFGDCQNVCGGKKVEKVSGIKLEKGITFSLSLRLPLWVDLLFLFCLSN